jgi:probable phosphoglycerate mutase
MRLLLARHAQTVSNLGRFLDTACPGAALTGLGHEQAARLAARLGAEPIEAVAASPLVRAQQTAEPVAAARGLAVVTLDGLCEIAAGELEGQNTAEAIGTYRDVISAWAAGELEVVMPGGSSGQEFFDRYDEAVRTLSDAGTCAVAVSHGAAIRIWVAARCRGVDTAAVSRRAVPNTGIVTVEGSARAGWRLLDWPGEIADTRQDHRS